MNTLIWITQVLMAVLFVFHGIAMFNPPAAVRESVVEKMGYSLPFLKTIGTLEVLGGLGLILPASTRVMPLLSPLAALGLVIIMIGAAVSQISRPVGIAMGVYGAARTIYTNVLGRGHEVTFPADTPIQVRLAAGPSVQ